MSTTFRRYAPDQSLLLPPAVRAWLPEGHLAHHVSDLVDGLDLTAFYGAYAGDGRRNAPYELRMMVKVLLYAYATGVFSSRGIARRLEEDVAFRVLAAGNFPQHRTVCEFRRRHLEDFKALFVAVVRLARELGLARFGKLSIDGTKVRASASMHKAMSYGRMQEEERRLAGEIDALVRAARDADAAEDERFGPDARGDELPSELRRREDRLAAIRAAKERLEAAQRAADDAGGRQPGQARNPKGGRPYKRGYGEPDEKAQSNFTDPESGIMKTSNDGFQQCYNAQVAVDGEHQLVVATEVTANASDQDESHGREAVEAGGSCGIRRTQVAVGGSARVDQTRAGIPPLQPAGAGEGARRVGLGVPGVERQAPARPDRGVTRGNEGWRWRPIGAHHGLWRTKWPVNAGSRHLPSNYLVGRPPKLLRHDKSEHGPTTHFTPRHLLRRRLLASGKLQPIFSRRQESPGARLVAAQRSAAVSDAGRSR